MKTKGRRKSKNVIDKRSYFGSEAHSGIEWKQRVKSFELDSFKSAREFSGTKSYNKFKK